MKLATFSAAGTTRIGVVEGEQIVDLSRAAPGLPTEMAAFLAAGDAASDVAKSAVASGDGRLSRSEVALLAPILRPPKILAIGLNYKDHIAETGRPMPEVPVVFNKQSTAVVAPGAAIHRPPESEQLDYEGELAVVIGRRCRRVSRAAAAQVVAGYTIVNDVSVRDWQFRVPTMTMGKSWDTHCPIGPWIVTADEIGDPHRLDIHTTVDGELRQRSNTSELLFDCFDLIAHLSTAFTLEPGDVISTGTPAGVGAAMQPPRWLVPGNVVRVAIEKLGYLENSVIDEPTTTVAS
jgi:2-keto-4-pentenoate hydratase/2-oxohepta-3-ene-1,7-dioic acid hydratase in catechol pathway